jgi:hypothetical protein
MKQAESDKQNIYGRHRKDRQNRTAMTNRLDRTTSEGQQDRGQQEEDNQQKKTKIGQPKNKSWLQDR